MALRPTFSAELACPSRTVIERLWAKLVPGPILVKRSRPPGGGPERGPRDEAHLMLTIRPEERHFWSPWLTVEITPRGEATHLRATFSPHPSVWTGFAFAYLILGVVCVVSLVFVASAALLPDSSQSWALWVTGGAALAIIAMWTASQIGQRLARDQMDTLRHELDRAVELCRVEHGDGAAPRRPPS